MAEQQSLPLGFVRGEPVMTGRHSVLPDALEVILDTFSGYMDLLYTLL